MKRNFNNHDDWVTEVYLEDEFILCAHYVYDTVNIDMDMSYVRRVRTASHSSHTSYSVSRKVLHQGTVSHSLHTSHSVSHKWRHTATAMRAHNVLCNSYNSWDEPLQLSSCTFCVVVHSYLFENCIAYFNSSKLVYHGTPNTHRCTTHPW
jgi:hypothetical protein